MHPVMMEELARQRERELRWAAERYGPLLPRRRRRSAWSRVGWVLVEIGFALASVSDDA